MDDRFAETAASNNPVTRAIGPGTTQTSQTLFNRIGGEKILDQIVTDVYNDMRADKEIGKLFARFRLERLKDRTVDYLRGEWGGPEPYKGSDLWISHSHMGIRNQWYDIMMKYYVKALKRAKVGKAETQECLNSLEKMRAPTVDRDLKFKNMYLKHSEKLAAAAGGDGWGKPSANPNSQIEAEKKKEQERLEKEKLKEVEAAKQKAEEEAKKKKVEAAKKRKAEKAAAAAAAAAEAAANNVENTSNPENSSNNNASGDAPDSSQSTKEPSDDGSASERTATTAASKERSKSRKNTNKASEFIPDPAFIFVPSEDAPPSQLPGSAPSAEELLCRMSRPCLGFSLAAVN